MASIRQRTLTRKAFLKASSALVGSVLAASLAPGGRRASAPGRNTAPDDAVAWAQAMRVRAAAQMPDVSPRSFLITDYGAVGDGQTDCTNALAAAIEACANAGGGRVVVPAGTFLTGAIHLRSQVDLHLQDEATLRFSRDPAAYLPAVMSRWQGIELFNYSAFVYAFGAEDVALTGTGTLDGQGDASHWWPWKGAGWPNESADWTLLQQMADQGVPVEQRVFGAGHYLRPSFVQFYRCRNVLIEGVTITNSPMWGIHPVLSQNVVVRGVTVNSHGPNNDGCDPDSCSDVQIQGCTFDSGDDCIAIKSGRGADGQRLNIPSENVLIEDCEFRDGRGGITLGSEMTGGVRNVVARNIRMTSPNLQNCLRIKTNSYRGGFVEQIFLRDASAARVAAGAIQIDYYYEQGAGGGFNPSVRDIDVRNLTVQAAKYALDLRGYPEDPIQRVRLTDCVFRGVASPNVIENVESLELRNVLIDGALA